MPTRPGTGFVLLLLLSSLRAQDPKPAPGAVTDPVPAAEAPAPPPTATGGVTADALRSLSWQRLGPANMEGRIVDLAVDPVRPSTFYVAAATGGLWKTTNAGTTFTPVFEKTGSLGAVAVAPSDPQVVWLGTGEANARNSVTGGDGVWRSKDGGKTWDHCGLVETRHIGRIAIDPRNPDTALVAALGHVFGPNPERGVFRTEDGGKTWTHVLAPGPDTGAVDVAIDPSNPDLVYAAAYGVRRDATDANDPIVKTTSGAGIYKSLDGGRSFVRKTAGLPTVPCGRIGLSVYRKNPAVVFAVIETKLTGKEPPSADPKSGEANGPAYLGVQAEDEGTGGGARIVELVPGAAAETAGLEVDDVILRIGDQDVGNYEEMLRAIRGFEPGAAGTVVVDRGGTKQFMEVAFGRRPPERAAGQLGGQAENRQASQGELGFETGGVFRSDDHGESWRRINTLCPRPFYFSQIRVDPEDDLRLFVLGIQLHESRDGGETFRNNEGARTIHVDHHALWIDPADPRHLVLGNDGGLAISHDRGANWEYAANLPIGQAYAVAVDRRVPYRLYAGFQDNGTWGLPRRTRFPNGTGQGSVYKIGQGDGFVCAVDPTDAETVYYESQNGGLQRLDLASGRSTPIRPPRAPERVRWRFNWKTPFILSPKNPRTLLFAAQRVFRSVDRGDSARAISSDLGRGPDGMVTALAESPRDEEVVWAGTDDGALHVTRDGGQNWEAVHDHLPGVPGPRWVAHVEASRTAAGTAYVVLDGHRSDDLEPYVFRTEDYGKSFERLVDGLPKQSTRVLREDPANAEVLYLGNEVGVFVSLDRGSHWIACGDGLPTVAVHDLVVHETERELVLATHGRGLCVLDVQAMPRLAGAAEAKRVRLFAPKPLVRWARVPGASSFGARRFAVPNPPDGTTIEFWLPSAPEGKIAVRIDDPVTNRERVLEVEAVAGLNRVTFDGNFDGRNGRAGVGRYRVRVKVGTEEVTEVVEVRGDPQSDTETEGDRP